MQEATQHDLFIHAIFQGTGSTLLTVSYRTDPVLEEIDKCRLLRHWLEWAQLPITATHEETAGTAAISTSKIIILFGKFSNGRIDTGLLTLFHYMPFKFFSHEVIESLSFLLRSHEPDRCNAPNTLKKLTSIYLHITTTSDQDS